MSAKLYLPKTWTDPRQAIYPLPIQGKDIFANAPIRAGEIIEIIRGS